MKTPYTSKHPVYTFIGPIIYHSYNYKYKTIDIKHLQVIFKRFLWFFIVIFLIYEAKHSSIQTFVVFYYLWMLSSLFLYLETSEILSCGGLSGESRATCDSWKFKPAATEWSFHSYPHKGYQSFLNIFFSIPSKLNIRWIRPVLS